MADTSANRVAEGRTECSVMRRKWEWGEHQVNGGMLRPLTAAVQGARLTKKCQFPVNCICTHATASRHPEHETCARDAAAAFIQNAAIKQTCLRFNVPTGHKVSPDPTRQKAKKLQVELQRKPQPTSAYQKRSLNRRNQKLLLQNNQKRTNRNTTLTPWRARNDDNNDTCT